MSIFAISDLHLSTNTDKSMEVFGDRWQGYTQKIFENWNKIVTPQDTVIIGGDVSWEMKISNCVGDFQFISNLPGRKIISKGNHDYWWETVTKMNDFISENDFSNIEFLYNNAFSVENVAVCGTRWWESASTDEDKKIYNHELVRLETSLSEGKKLNCEKTIAVLHYPPFEEDGSLNNDIKELFQKYNVDECIYGHLHGSGINKRVEGEFFGTKYHLTSADYLNFSPLPINFKKI